MKTRGDLLTKKLNLMFSDSARRSGSEWMDIPILYIETRTEKIYLLRIQIITLSKSAKPSAKAQTSLIAHHVFFFIGSIPQGHSLAQIFLTRACQSLASIFTTMQSYITVSRLALSQSILSLLFLYRVVNDGTGAANLSAETCGPASDCLILPWFLCT